MDQTERVEKNLQEMKKLNVDVDQGADLEAIERAAREAVDDRGEKLSLVAWFDATKKTGGPQPACRGELPGCARSYAASHGADVAVEVDNGNYEFFYSHLSEGSYQPDMDAAVEIHRGLETSEAYPPGA